MTREEVIEALSDTRAEFNCFDPMGRKKYHALSEAIKKLQESKTGKWLGGELGECSVCGHTGCASDIWDRCQEHYCPNCGARMEENG